MGLSHLCRLPPKSLVHCTRIPPMSKKLVNNESIYSLVPPEEAKKERPPRYTSKYPGTTAPTASTFGAASKSATGIHNAGGDYDEPPTAHPVRQATASFGPEGRTLDTHNPLAFTRCHQKEPRLPSRTFPFLARYPPLTRLTLALLAQGLVYSRFRTRILRFISIVGTCSVQIHVSR